MPSLTGRTIAPKKPKPERGTAAGRAHMARVKQLPCVICSAPPPSDAHHVFHDRFGSRKASDFDTIPLCHWECHQGGPQAIHNDKSGWRDRHGPDHSYLPIVRQMLGETE